MSFFWFTQLFSVVGVAAVIALTWAVGWSTRAKIASLEDAAKRFRRDFPSTDVKGGTLATDGRGALLDLGEGAGLVTVLGDEFVTRKLRARDVTATDRGGVLVLRLADPTLPRARLTLSVAEAATWTASLSSPVYGGGGPRSGGGGSPVVPT